MTIAENIKKLRKEKNLLQKEVAEIIGVTRPAYSYWEKGTYLPTEDKLESLSKLFEVDVADITQDDKVELNGLYDELSKNNKEKTLTYVNKLHREQTQNQSTPIKLFPVNVYEKLSAGTGFNYFDDGSFETVYTEKEFRYDFASWINGDSMEPEFPNGNVALIRDIPFDINGEVYAVDWDGQTYIKKVYKEDSGLRLVSLNKKYKDKFAPFDEQPRVIGKIVGNFAPIDNSRA
ncbi:XRE family transcriptional regulator [Pseudolactococcus insecticola]|uniref:Transcriptional regulator n=1 Tax=Pseudolactococcus insecticola TaxID=2709158 RepID=A0A6A0B8S8_9LACT|nr:XRE family transcriptional regulator [Lactococcus insecticola]GFH41246.1 transcriptional regulator [Lactococcus insecticola]